MWPLFCLGLGWNSAEEYILPGLQMALELSAESGSILGTGGRIDPYVCLLLPPLNLPFFIRTMGLGVGGVKSRLQSRSPVISGIF